MPVLGEAFPTFENAQNLGMRLERLVRVLDVVVDAAFGMHDRAQPLREGDLRLGFEVLRTQHDDDVLDQRAPDGRDFGIVDATQIDAVDLHADRAGETFERRSEVVAMCSCSA